MIRQGTLGCDRAYLISISLSSCSSHLHANERVSIAALPPRFWTLTSYAGTLRLWRRIGNFCLTRQPLPEMHTTFLRQMLRPAGPTLHPLGCVPVIPAFEQLLLSSRRPL
ncbi:hypothetical protein IQ06DRAFT_32677 [Phaeosphaeriaceae sp. SRC1lsM3a]|nr:hypothetical protein IQ06DRAFT_32677 [Stagonospora sp. SRC1lsM3a]